MTWKGFLDRDNCGHARMTEEQITQIRRAISIATGAAARAHTHPDDLLMLAGRVVDEAVAAYSRDRSCRTCDYLDTAEFCQRWQRSPPQDVVDAKGCDHHQCHGAPF